MSQPAQLEKSEKVPIVADNNPSVGSQSISNGFLEAGPGSEIDWTPEEERRVLLKTDLIVMPLLIVGFMCLQLDRGNIGNALTDFFLTDVGITQNQFNLGAQLLSVGIVLLELPSNLVLYRIGPRAWLSGQMFAWGLVATFQAFQKGGGLGPFLSTRLLLGLCEAGFIPASLYCMTMWYKRDETSKRFSIFFIGNFASQAISNLVAYGILQMRGISGLAGWQWLFILEGLVTITVSFIFLALFPYGPSNPSPLTGMEYFNAREKEILWRRVVIDDPSKVNKSKNIKWDEIWVTVKDWRVYTHCLITLGALAPTNTMTSYAPTLVKSFGYARLKSNAIVSIGSWCLTVMVVIWGFLADIFNRRGPFVTLGISLWLFLAIGNLIASYHPKERSARLGCLLSGIAVSNIFHPVNSSWLSHNARTPGERSIRLAMIIMSANMAGIIGSQLFQQQDGPLYHTGWSAIIALIAFGFVMSILANLQYFFLNKRLDRKEAAGELKEEDKGWRYAK